MLWITIDVILDSIYVFLLINTNKQNVEINIRVARCATKRFLELDILNTPTILK